MCFIYGGIHSLKIFYQCLRCLKIYNILKAMPSIWYTSNVIYLCIYYICGCYFLLCFLCEKCIALHVGTLSCNHLVNTTEISCCFFPANVAELWCCLRAFSSDLVSSLLHTYCLLESKIEIKSL